MNPTATTLTALAILLACFLAPPATATAVPPECTAFLGQDLRGTQDLRWTVAEVARSCGPNLCPSGSVGVEGKCIPVDLTLCGGQGRNLVEACGIGLCPKGSVGVTTEKKDACVKADLQTEPCPGNEDGVVLGSRAVCLDHGSCPTGQTGAIVEGHRVCVARNSFPKLPEVPGMDNGTNPSCARSDDDFWPGGSHVKCHYACPALAALAIDVTASDLDAVAYGDTSCADATASCNGPGPHCVGASDGVTSYGAEDQECNGYTDEANSSPVTVHCWSIAPSKLTKGLCYVAPELCTLGASRSPDLLGACLASRSVPPGAEPVVARLAASSPRVFSSLVAFEASLEGVTAIVADSRDGVLACHVEAL